MLKPATVGEVVEHDGFRTIELTGDRLAGVEWVPGDKLRIRVGDGWAPFDLVRRYLVTGVIDGGRGRQYQHDAIVTAISQIARWGPGEIDVFADQDDWRAARLAVTRLMERYHRA